MQQSMNLSQFSTLNKQIMMVQLHHNRLSATNLLLTNIQMNYLLTHDEAECGLSPISEDLGKSFEVLMFVRR